VKCLTYPFEARREIAANVGSSNPVLKQFFMVWDIFI
jgi:hypothetical protein